MDDSGLHIVLYLRLMKRGVCPEEGLPLQKMCLSAVDIDGVDDKRKEGGKKKKKKEREKEKGVVVVIVYCFVVEFCV